MFNHIFFKNKTSQNLAYTESSSHLKA